MSLVVFSDSVGVGQHLSPNLGWVHRVAGALPSDVLVVNASVNGDTSRTALLRMAHDVPLCDVLYVQFGLNDCNRWATEHGSNRVSEDAFYADLVEIAARSRGARVIFAANHRTAKDPDYDQRARDYNVLVRDAATFCGADLVDMETHDVHLLDGIHPSALGHITYAHAILPIVRRLLYAVAA